MTKIILMRTKLYTAQFWVIIAICCSVVFPTNIYSEGIAAERIPIGKNLYLEKSFDYSTYFGVIRSHEELENLWSHLVKKGHTLLFPKAVISPPPEIDFNNYQVLWFANKGSNASYIESVDLVDDTESDKIIAKVKVWHSDFGSRELNLWKIPRVSKEITFQEIHYYDRGP